MVGDDQLTKETASGGGSGQGHGVNRVISRWGDLESSRSVASHGLGFSSNPSKPLKVKTFTNPAAPGGTSRNGSARAGAGLKTGLKTASRVAPGLAGATSKTQKNGKAGAGKPAKKASKLSTGAKKKVVGKKATKKLKDDKVLIAIWALIGVVILIIAGLVLGLVLPKAEKEARESARVQDMVRVSNAVVLYQRDHSANRSNLPAAGSWVGTAYFPDNCSLNSACSFVEQYLNSDVVSGLTTDTVDDYENHFKDPDGAYYNLVITDNLATTKNVSKVFELEMSDVVETTTETSPESETTESDAAETNDSDAGETETDTTDEGVAAEAEGGEVQVNSLKDALSRTESLSYNGEGYEFIPAHDWRGESVGLSHTIYIVPGAKCRGELIVKATRNSFAVVYNLENGARCLSSN